MSIKSTYWNCFPILKRNVKSLTYSSERRWNCTIHKHRWVFKKIYLDVKIYNVSLNLFGFGERRLGLLGLDLALRPEHGGGASERYLGQILAVVVVLDHLPEAEEGASGASLEDARDARLGRASAVPAGLGAPLELEAALIGGSRHAERLLVHEARVPERRQVRQVVRLAAKRLRDVAALHEEGVIIANHHP